MWAEARRTCAGQIWKGMPHSIDKQLHRHLDYHGDVAARRRTVQSSATGCVIRLMGGRSDFTGHSYEDL